MNVTCCGASIPPSHTLRMQLLLRRMYPLRLLTWRCTICLVLAAWLVSLAVHHLPWGGASPLAEHLLPAFWVAFVAVYLFGAAGGLVTALTIPLLNLVALEQPVFESAGQLALELAVFSVLTGLAVQRWPALRLTAPLAWLPAKLLVLALVWALPVSAPGGEFATVVVAALPGLGVLLVLNVALVMLLPKDRDWDAV